MSNAETSIRIDKRPVNWRAAFIAGLLGGLVGTAVKTLCEIISPPRPPGQPSPLGKGISVVVVMITGHDLPEPTQHLAESIVHWIFGAGAGIVYALIAEELPWATLGYGTLFGVAFWVSFHEMLLPVMGWSASPAKMTFHEQGNELVSHILFGIGVELTRRMVRKRFDAS